MNRKKEPKELIEVLLREQRARAPAGEDPLEGIDWTGLPEGLRDKVYQPPAQKEPLVDLLLSVEREKRRARAEDARPPVAEGGALPEPPSLRERLGTWLGHNFGFMGKSCEVRVVTVVAFAASSLVLTFVAYLYGFEKGRMAEPLPPLTAYTGAPGDLAIEGPKNTPRPEDLLAPKANKAVKGEGNATPDARKGSGQPVAPAPQETAPKQPWVVRIMTVVEVTPKNKESADTFCARLREAGVADPSVVMIDRGRQLVIIAGGWADQAEATRSIASIRSKIESLRGIDKLLGPIGTLTAWKRP